MNGSPGKSDSAQIEVDVDDLIIAFQSQNFDSVWFLDLETGAVRLCYDGMLDGEDVEEDFDIDAYLDPDRHRVIRGISSSISYGFMEDFIEDLPQGRVKEQLSDAISRSKPFRRFKDALFELGEVRETWFRFEEECYARYSQEWLDDESIEAKLVKKRN